MLFTWRIFYFAEYIHELGGEGRIALVWGWGLTPFVSQIYTFLATAIETQLEKSIVPGAFITTLNEEGENIALFCCNTYPCFALTAPRALFAASPGQLYLCHTPLPFPVLSREYNITLLLMHVRAVYRVLVFLGVKLFSSVVHRCELLNYYCVHLQGRKVSQASDQQEVNRASSILGLLFNL